MPKSRSVNKSKSLEEFRKVIEKIAPMDKQPNNCVNSEISIFSSGLTSIIRTSLNKLMATIRALAPITNPQITMNNSTHQKTWFIKNCSKTFQPK